MCVCVLQTTHHLSVSITALHLPAAASAVERQGQTHVAPAAAAAAGGLWTPAAAAGAVVAAAAVAAGAAPV